MFLVRLPVEVGAATVYELDTMQISRSLCLLVDPLGASGMWCHMIQKMRVDGLDVDGSATETINVEM